MGAQGEPGRVGAPAARRERPYRAQTDRGADDGDAIVRALVAFANDYEQVGGGEVACGVRQPEQGDDVRGVAVGLSAHKRNTLRKEILNKCQKQVTPPLGPRVVAYPVASDPTRRVLVFQQPASGEVHTFNGRYYVRTHDQTQLAQPSQVAELIRRRESLHYLEHPCESATIEDLDLIVVRAFLDRLPDALPWERYLEPDVRISSDARPLVEEQRLPGGGRRLVPNRFAVLLFGSEPLRARVFPGATVAVAIFSSADRGDDPRVTRAISGPLAVQARELVARLENEAGLQIDKTQSPLNGHPNWPRYSAQALREAAINALVHRDYTDGNPVQVDILPDRIIIASPGGFMKGVQPERVKRGEGSALWRNPSLAAFMVEMQFAQRKGTGIRRMIEETVRIAGEPPVFIDEAGRVTVEIPAYVPRPRIDLGAAGEQALVLLSIGGPSIREQVEASLPGLGLGAAGVVLDYAHEGYVETERAWQACAQEIRNRLRVWGDAPQIRHFHIFYRGPVAFAALVGALIPHAKAFSMYHYGERGYERAFTVDRRFRAQKD